MDARFYTVNDREIDIEGLAKNLVDTYYSQGYQAQYIGDKDQVIVQLKKGSDLEALVGLQATLSLTLRKSGSGVLAAIGQQKWIDKAAIGAVSFILPVLWPLAISAGLGVFRQAGQAGQVLAMLDGFVKQQYPGAQINAIRNQGL